MKVAPAVIVLVRDPDGFGPALAGALQPLPDCALRREVSSFELSLEKYGLGGRTERVELVQFLDPQGSPQVSILLLPNYGPPIAACAVHELVTLVKAEKFSYQPTLVIPFIMKTLKLNHETKNQTLSSHEGAVYGAEIGATSDLSQAMLSGTAKAPPSLRINCEPIACLIHMVHVLNLPTVLLIATAAQNQTKGASDNDLEALFEVGQFVADRIGLCFSRDIQLKPVERSHITQEPWRALYG